jgi:Ca2+-dependent lipid-binding protein
MDFSETFKEAAMHSLKKSTNLKELLRSREMVMFLLAFLMALFRTPSAVVVAVVAILYSTKRHITDERKNIKIARELMKHPELLKEFLKIRNQECLISKIESTEGNEWMNAIIAKWWPFANSIIQTALDKQGFSDKRHRLSSKFYKIYFQRFNLGDKHPVIGKIHVHKVANPEEAKEIVIECNVSYYGNCVLSVRRRILKLFAVKAGIKDIFFQGNVKITLHPLLPEPPFFGGMTICLTEPPFIDFDGTELAHMVDNKIVKKLLLNVICAHLLHPNVINIPLK